MLEDFVLTYKHCCDIYCTTRKPTALQNQVPMKRKLASPLERIQIREKIFDCRRLNSTHHQPTLQTCKSHQNLDLNNTEKKENN